MQVIHPEYFYACLIFVVVMLIPTRKDYSTRRARIMTMLPQLVSMLGFAFIFAMAQPYTVSHEKVRVPQPINMIALVDDSGSMGQRSALNQPTRSELAVQGVRDFAQARPAAAYGLTLFGETARIVSPISRAGAGLPADATKVAFEYGAGKFDAGFASALEQFDAVTGPEQRVLVLFTDGEGIAYFDKPTKISAELARSHVSVYLVQMTNAAGVLPKEGKFIRDFVEQLGDSPFTMFTANDSKSVQSSLSMISHQVSGNMMWETRTTRQPVAVFFWLWICFFVVGVAYLGFGPGSQRLIEEEKG